MHRIKTHRLRTVDGILPARGALSGSRPSADPGPRPSGDDRAALPCRCGELSGLRSKVALLAAGDWESIEVRRPAGIRRTQTWRTVKLGEKVTNTGFGAPDQPVDDGLSRSLARRESAGDSISE